MRYGAGDARLIAFYFTLGSECVIDAFLFWSASANKSDSFFNTFNCSFSIVAKGTVGIAFFSACESFVGATVAASANESIDILPRCGGNLNVRMIRVALVAGTKT